MMFVLIENIDSTESSDAEESEDSEHCSDVDSDATEGSLVDHDSSSCSSLSTHSDAPSVSIDLPRKRRLGRSKYSEAESRDLLKIVQEYRDKGGHSLTAGEWEEVATKLNAKHPEVPKRTRRGLEQKVRFLNTKNKKAMHQKDQKSNGMNRERTATNSIRGCGWSYSKKESQDLLKIVQKYTEKGGYALKWNEWEEVATKLNAKHPEVPQRTKYAVRKKFYDLNEKKKKFTEINRDRTATNGTLTFVIL